MGFVREPILRVAAALVVVGAFVAAMSPIATAQSASVTPSPSTVTAGESFNALGKGWPPQGTVEVRWQLASSPVFVTANGGGNFTVTFNVAPGTGAGLYRLSALDTSGNSARSDVVVVVATTTTTSQPTTTTSQPTTTTQPGTSTTSSFPTTTTSQPFPTTTTSQPFPTTTTTRPFPTTTSFPSTTTTRPFPTTTSFPTTTTTWPFPTTTSFPSTTTQPIPPPTTATTTATIVLPSGTGVTTTVTSPPATATRPRTQPGPSASVAVQSADLEAVPVASPDPTVGTTAAEKPPRRTLDDSKQGVATSDDLALIEPDEIEVREANPSRPPPPTLPEVAGEVAEEPVEGVQISRMTAARSALNPSLLYVTIDFSQSTASGERVYIMIDNRAAGVVAAEPGESALYEVDGVSSGEHLVEILAPDGSVIASATIVAAARSYAQEAQWNLPIVAIITALMMVSLLVRAVRAHRATRHSTAEGDHPAGYSEEEEIDSLALP